MGKCLIVMVSVVTAMMILLIGVNDAKLSYNYYESKCPKAEATVKQVLLTIFLTDPTAPSAFLRLFFHDCQVQGCDASILLDSDEFSMTSEMVSSKNFGIKKREMIDQIKTVLEEECPGEVSCADVIAMAARESVAFSGGPEIQIPMGRKDSIKCSNREADLNLPSHTLEVDGLIEMFTSKGMNLEESVAILGAHTLGVGHCINIVDRLYSDDLHLHQWNDNGFKLELNLKCPNQIPVSNLTWVPNDLTPLIFDNQYYRDVMNGRGLFDIDSRISSDRRTAPVVWKFSSDQDYFFGVFSSAFVKLSLANVLSEGEGEVRRQCNRVN